MKSDHVISSARGSCGNNYQQNVKSLAVLVGHATRDDVQTQSSVLLECEAIDDN